MWIRYDTKTSLINIRQSNIVDIERYVNANRNRFEAVLKGTTYETGTFQFLPGHASLILLFPELLSKSKSKSKFQQPNKRSQSNQTNDTTADHPEDIVNHESNTNASINVSVNVLDDA